MITLPGLIDPHVHLRTPGQEQKEDFFTGTSAALAGGFTTIIDMPNNSEPITTLPRLEQKIAVAREQTVCDIGFHFGSLGDNLEEFSKVADKVIGLKLYLNQTTGNYLLDKSHLEKIFTTWPKEKVILVHAEEQTFADVLDVVKKVSRSVHLCHMSTQFELEKIIEAKEQGLPVTCGVTPHHLFLTAEDGKNLGPYGMMKPVLKPRSDVDFLWQHLDAVDLIESDHAPHKKEEKESEIIPFGVPGLETTLPLLLTAVSDNRLEIADVIRLCHDGPAKIFRIKKDADSKVEVDENEEWEIRNENLFTKCKWSPFDGWKVRGKVKRVVLRGQKVFEDDKILVKEGSGKVIF